MIGLPVGIALSFLGSSFTRTSLWLALHVLHRCDSGIVCAVLALAYWEPVRGSAEVHQD